MNSRCRAGGVQAQYEEAVEHGQQRAEATHSLQQHTFDEAPLITPMPIPSEFDVEMVSIPRRVARSEL